MTPSPAPAPDPSHSTLAAAAPGPGKLIIISGPSASGKTTLLAELFRRRPGPLVPSVSATTRSPRPGEQDGRHYHFLTNDEFQRRRQNGDFLECFEVYGRGYWYGTLKNEVTAGLNAGQWVVLEIDVHGALEVLKSFPEAVTIFVHPGSLAELERRLRGRGTEQEADIQRRLATAQDELKYLDRYRHQVINDDLQRAVDELCRLLTGAPQTAAPWPTAAH